MITKDYFSDVAVSAEQYEKKHRHEALLYNIAKNYSDELLKNPSKYHIAILGIPEDRNSNNKGAASAPDEIRKKLYALYKPFDNLRVIDLGNIRQGKSVNDTYVAVKDVVAHLLDLGILPLMIGGTHDLAYSVYKAYENKKTPYNIVSIDARFDMENHTDNLHANSVLGKIVTDKPSYLFNYSTLAYQTYYTPEADRKLMADMYFDYLRLGEIRNDITLAEPFLRDADFVSFDISAVQMNDAPAHQSPSIHGLHGEEACQLAKYAGMSDKLTAFGLYEINPTHDNRGQTAKLGAQIIWHFIQGYYLRQKDYPVSKLKKYKKFIVETESPEGSIIFYQSQRTGRWWIEIPYEIKNKKHKLIAACSQESYEQAGRNEIPDIWWKYYQKLN